MNDTRNMVKLTPDTYYDFANDCIVEIKDTKERINELQMEFDDKEKFIRASREEIEHLMESINAMQKDQKKIKYRISKHEKCLSVDSKFLNKLTKIMNRKNSETHLVDYQKRKVLRG